MWRGGRASEENKDEGHDRNDEQVNKASVTTWSAVKVNDERYCDDLPTAEDSDTMQTHG